MIGKQDERPAQQIRRRTAVDAARAGGRSAGGAAPGERQTNMDRPAARHAGDRVGQDVQQGRRLHSQGQRMSAQRRPVRPGPGGERQEGAGPHVGPLRRGPAGVALQRRAVPAPQQAGCRFQGLGLRQVHGVAPAVVELSALHRGDRRVQHRLAPGDGAGRHLCRLAAAGLALRQQADLRSAIEAAPRIGWVRPRREAAATDIGVEGLGPHPQPRTGLFGPDPVGHIDYRDQD